MRAEIKVIIKKVISARDEIRQAGCAFTGLNREFSTSLRKVAGRAALHP